MLMYLEVAAVGGNAQLGCGATYDIQGDAIMSCSNTRRLMHCDTGRDTGPGYRLVGGRGDSAGNDSSMAP